MKKSYVFGGLLSQGYPKPSTLMLEQINSPVKSIQGARMTLAAIEQTLSINRLSTYRRAIFKRFGEDCPRLALKLYEWNAELSSYFFFPLHIYEVVLRNAISDAIAIRYGQDWPINVVFQNSLNYPDRQTLLKALDGNYRGVGKLLPELKFVWFENMLTSRHDGRIWRQYFTYTFPYAPNNLSTAKLRVQLKEACYVIRKFRNRCGHHEPIFNNGSLYEIYPLIAKSVQWRCCHTKQWMDERESVTKLLGCLVTDPLLNE